MAEETTQAVAVIEDDPIEVRRAKRQALLDAGVDPYGHAFERSHSIEQLNATYDHLEEGASTEDEVTVAGRVMARRVQGKIAFLELFFQQPHPLDQRIIVRLHLRAAKLNQRDLNQNTLLCRVFDAVGEF